MTDRTLLKVKLVTELDDGTRDEITHCFISSNSRANDKQKESWALAIGDTLKQDFIRYMYDIVWAE